jgi:hypothetical protein
LEAKIEANSKRSDDLQGTLVSLMDIHQARTKSTQEEMLAGMEGHHERMVRLDSQLDKRGVCPVETETMDLETKN